MAIKKIESNKSVLKPVVRKASVQDQARNVWLAGLGAFSVAQNEGKKVFGTMVNEGQKIEAATRKVVDNSTKDVRKAVEGRLTLVRDTASEQINKLEKVFENRVSSVLGRLGIPSRDDVQTLSKRVAELSKEVKALSGKGKLAA
jgi:poly(hydroxyalkanoate) granule-associated protein